MNTEHPLMTSAEVAEAFGVQVRSVGKWRRQGKIASITTPGSREYRYFRAEIEAFLDGAPLTPAQVQALREQLLTGGLTSARDDLEAVVWHRLGKYADNPHIGDVDAILAAADRYAVTEYGPAAGQHTGPARGGQP